MNNKFLIHPKRVRSTYLPYGYIVSGVRVLTVFILPDVAGMQCTICSLSLELGF